MRKNLKNNGTASGKRKRIAAKDVPKLVKAGRALLSKGQTDELIRVCSDALRQLPGHPEFIRLQFLALIEEKKYSETIRFLQKWGKHPASKSVPTQYVIGYGYYLIKRYKSAHETCNMVGELLHRPKLTVRQKTQLHFSAGRIADHQGRYHDAFRCFAEAKNLSTNEFDFGVFGKAVTACTSEAGAPAGSLPARFKQAPAVTPLFILGLPRSGKTTLENLLARRPEFAACGEVSPRMFVDEDIFIGAQGQLPSNYADRLASMKSTQQDMYARQYTEQICEQFSLPKTTRYIINTMPHNFLNIRTINKIFSSSKFIYIKRNNHDLFTFCYMKNFKNEYNYTREFDTFIRYCNMFHEIVSHWQNALSSNFATVSYEDMVRSPDAILDQLYGFLDVDISIDHPPAAKAATVDLTNRYVDYWKNYQNLFSHTDTPCT